MALPMEKLKREVAEERRRLETGEAPPPRLKSRVQRTAVRALAAFFVLMLALTLLSRAADGITVARVEAEVTKTGVLTQRFTASGTIEAQGDLTILLPGGIGVSRINARQGAHVAVGDTLLELDVAGLERTLEKLHSDLTVLNMKIANAAQGGSGASTDAILSAQQALETAQEDRDRLAQSRERTEKRTAEDLSAAQENYDEALLGLGKAGERAKKALVKAAQEQVDGVQKMLEDTKEAAATAIEAAEQTLASAEDAQSNADDQITKAAGVMMRARERLAAAQAKLLELQDSPDADPNAIAQAESEVASAQSAVDAAQGALDSMDSGSAFTSVRRARENLKKIKEKQAAKQLEAEAEQKEAKAELEKVTAQIDMREEALVLSAQSAADAAESTLKTAQRGVEDAAVATEDQIFAAERAIETAQRALNTAQQKAAEERRTDEKSRQQAEIERLGYQSDKRALRQTLGDLEAVAASGGKVVASVAGTVQFILAETGKTQDGVKVAVLSRSDQGFLFAAEIDQKDAEKLTIGDKGTLSYRQEGNTKVVQAAIASIGAADDKGKVRVEVALPEGRYSGGTSGEFERAKRSEQYNSTLPLGALRSDAHGSFVLVLRETQTVMGAEQTVARVDVKVLGQDSERMAVESTLSYDDKVIVSTNKPIAEGDRIRLETEKENK